VTRKLRAVLLAGWLLGASLPLPRRPYGQTLTWRQATFIVVFGIALHTLTARSGLREQTGMPPPAPVAPGLLLIELDTAGEPWPGPEQRGRTPRRCLQCHAVGINGESKLGGLRVQNIIPGRRAR